MSEEIKNDKKTVDDLITDIRGQLVALRGVPISGIVAAGKYIEWKLRDLEQAVRALDAKYEYAREAATSLFKRGRVMRARQCRYFKERTVVALQESKDAEKAFDAVVLAIAKHGKPQQAELPIGGGSEVKHG